MRSVRGECSLPLLLHAANVAGGSHGGRGDVGGANGGGGSGGGEHGNGGGRGDAARAVALVGTVAWAARSVAWAARLVVPAVAMVAVAVAVGKAARAVAPEKQHTHPARICVHTWLERGRRSPTLSGDASG